MLRYGQAIKLKREIRQKINVRFIKAWGIAYKIQKIKNSELPEFSWVILPSSRNEHREDYKERYRWLVLPKGTFCLLSLAFINLSQEIFYVKVQNPKTKNPSNFNFKLGPDDITTDLDLVERESVRIFQAKFIANRCNMDDALGKMKRIEHLVKQI